MMLKRWIAGIGLFLFLSGMTSDNAPVSSEKINGVSFVASVNKIGPEAVQPVVDVNANWAVVNPFGIMFGADKSKLLFDTDRQWWGSRKMGMIKTIDLFKSKGLKVLLKPQLWITGGVYTGTIKMSSEQEWEAFETGYLKFIITAARIAESRKVEMFCIGTELSSFTTERPEFWKELIQEVKKVYKGELTYAANWDTYQNPGFWDQLDYIGIDAYFPLSESKTPTIAELEQGWAPVKERIRRFAEEKQKQVIFTEYGYRSVDYAAREPWNSSNSLNSVNHEGQANCLKAIYRVFWDEEWFKGGFLWKWYDYQERAGGLKNTQYTVQNKPSQRLVQQLYSDSAND